MGRLDVAHRVDGEDVQQEVAPQREGQQHPAVGHALAGGQRLGVQPTVVRVAHLRAPPCRVAVLSGSQWE
jgi:hypothetical protein